MPVHTYKRFAFVLAAEEVGSARSTSCLDSLCVPCEARRRTFANTTCVVGRRLQTHFMFGGGLLVLCGGTLHTKHADI
jgi:hypothetical protein